MNDNLKFRVYNTLTKTWVHGPGEEVYIFGEMILLGGFMKGIRVEDLEHCVVLQYTGLKDRDGKEIYQGDLVKWWWDTEEDGYTGMGMGGYSLVEKLQEIIFDCGCFGFEHDRFRILSKEKVRVVGSIYA